MDTLHAEIQTLSSRVDSLSRLIEQMSQRISDVAVECKTGSEQSGKADRNHFMSYRSSGGYAHLDGTLDHKDILVETNGLDAISHQGEKQLSPEIQIQRLTAQLTAAYNRIAALEEQLLLKRVH
jgi:hypothetical protein